MYEKFQIPGEAFRALGLNMKILITVVISGLLIWSIMLLPFPASFNNQLLDATTNVESKESETPTNTSIGGLAAAVLNEGSYSKPKVPKTPIDKLIGGLLTADFDEGSCSSRYQKTSLYRKPSPYKPSKYLISKLRKYEIRHKRCGPGTEAYNKAAEHLGRDEYYASNSGECKYIVWIAGYGLGNQILTLTSVFLYALLTERTILVDQRKDIHDLLCEPFPGRSWLLPLDFPIVKHIDWEYNKEYPRCYGTMVKSRTINSTSKLPHLYLHNIHDSRDEDQMFFCKKDQRLINKVPWLIIKSNVYFVPSLWLNPTFYKELVKLFPQKDTVFHHLARYLLHPTNQVWGMVTRYYHAHLVKADESLGIQIRVFREDAGYFQHVMDQVVRCTQREKLLPELATQEEESNFTTPNNPKLKSVLVTSLFPEYSDTLKNMYWERPSSTGEIIEVYQPSGERTQQTDKKNHDQKALAEIFLLSLTDNIVTSARSTFGYVAYSLGGLKPWLLYQPAGNTTPDPPCVRSKSMEPCYLTPPAHGCDANWGKNSGKIVPFIKHCEDIWYGGLKLHDEL